MEKDKSVLKIDHISGMNTLRIRDFSYSQQTSETHILLCPSVKFLDELQGILQKKIMLQGGYITLDGKDCLSNSMRRMVQVVGSEDMLFREMTVLENVFRDKCLYNARKKKMRERFAEIMQETEYQVNEDTLVKNLSGEQRKIVEILYYYYRKPKLLVVRELSAIVSHRVFMRFLNVLDRLNKEGITVLYLASQWEECLRVGKDVTLIMNGEQHSVYSAEEVRKDPSVLCYAVMGGQHFQERYVKDDMEYDLFRALSTSISRVPIGNSIRQTIRMFTNYLIQVMRADSVIIYLLDSNLKKILESVEYAKEGENSKLKPEIIWNILNKNQLFYLNWDDFSFAGNFDKNTTNQTVICYPGIVSDSLALLLQVEYKGHYTYTERDSVLIEWVAQEMAIFIENSRLMGKSMLLRESHHRIKNNLQIIVSLMEMEKERCFLKIKDSSIQEEIENTFDSAIGRIKCIAQIHDLLTKESAQNSFMDMHTIVKAVSVFYLSGSTVNLQFDSIYVPYSKAVSVALVVNEIISNSVKHNRLSKEALIIDIITNIEDHNQAIHLTCKDNGVGYPCPNGMEYINRSDGIGMLVIDSIIRMEFDGEYHFYNNDGAIVDIIIPQKALLPVEKRKLND